MNLIIIPNDIFENTKFFFLLLMFTLDGIIINNTYVLKQKLFTLLSVTNTITTMMHNSHAHTKE